MPLSGRYLAIVVLSSVLSNVSAVLSNLSAVLSNVSAVLSNLSAVADMHCTCGENFKQDGYSQVPPFRTFAIT